MKNDTFQEEFIKTKLSITKVLRKVYVFAFNIYAWFWLYRLIFIKDDSSLEDYLLWFFACVGMWFFVLDGPDKKLRDLHLGE
jgi:hypothetical protein